MGEWRRKWRRRRRRREFFSRGSGYKLFLSVFRSFFSMVRTRALTRARTRARARALTRALTRAVRRGAASRRRGGVVRSRRVASKQTKAMNRPDEDEDEVEVVFKSKSDDKEERFTANPRIIVGDMVHELSARTGHPFIGLYVSMHGIPVHLQMTIKEASQLHKLLSMFNSYMKGNEEDEKNKEKFALHFEAELNKVLKKLALKRRQGKSLCFEKLYALFEHHSPTDESTVRSITIDVIKYDVPIPKDLFVNEFLMWKLLRKLLELRGDVKGGTIDQVLYFEKGSPFVGKTLQQVARGEQSQIRTTHHPPRTKK